MNPPNPSRSWPGERLLHGATLIALSLAWLSSLAIHLAAVGRYQVPDAAILTVLLGVFLGLALFARYLSRFLSAVLELSLLHALQALNARPSETGHREAQARLHQFTRACWRSIPKMLRWLVLPATLYLAWLTYAYLLETDPRELRLFGPGSLGLRLYSAVWLATTAPAWCFLAFYAHSGEP